MGLARRKLPPCDAANHRIALISVKACDPQLCHYADSAHESAGDARFTFLFGFAELRNCAMAYCTN
jgi:hypothetical protein